MQKYQTLLAVLEASSKKGRGEGEMKVESMDVSVSKDVKILSNGQH